jgi:O-methyltransferase
MLAEQSTDMHDDAPFPELVDPIRDLTMISEMNLYAAFNAVRHVARVGVAGDIVECGVWKGGCSGADVRVAAPDHVALRHVHWHGRTR